MPERNRIGLLKVKERRNTCVSVCVRETESMAEQTISKYVRRGVTKGYSHNQCVYIQKTRQAFWQVTIPLSFGKSVFLSLSNCQKQKCSLNHITSHPIAPNGPPPAGLCPVAMGDRATPLDISMGGVTCPTPHFPFVAEGAH